MKKLTPILICILAIFVGALFVMNFYGITEPVIYYSQFEETSVSERAPVVDENELDDLVVPDYYNCIDYGKISSARDQGELGACWAFATNAALESRLRPDEVWDFSEDHMIYNNGFYNNSTEGGDYVMAVAYLASWKGPVTEEDDPYNDGATNTDAEVVKHVQDVYFLQNESVETIKKMIYCYGAVESSIYIAVDEDQYLDETYYNRSNYSYNYDGKEDANHEIVIIGWDDSYSASNFNIGSYSDGAFICLNSWGAGFGDNGIFYVSYNDECIGDAVEVYVGVEDVDNYDNIYQADEHGWVGRMGFDESSAFFANVYTADSDESLEAVSFYATDENTNVNIYVVKNFTDSSDLLSGRVLCAQADFDYTGYYTVDLDEAISLDAGERFAVIVEIDTPGSRHPVAIEMDDGYGRTGEVSLEGNESYVSLDGRSWDNTQEESSCNVCLKAFTKDR